MINKEEFINFMKSFTSKTDENLETINDNTNDENKSDDNELTIKELSEFVISITQSVAELTEKFETLTTKDVDVTDADKDSDVNTDVDADKDSDTEDKKDEDKKDEDVNPLEKEITELKEEMKKLQKQPVDDITMDNSEVSKMTFSQKLAARKELRKNLKY